LSILYASIYDLSSFNPPLGFPTWHTEKPVGLWPALDRSRFLSVRSIADPILADQLDSSTPIRIFPMPTAVEDDDDLAEAARPMRSWIKGKTKAVPAKTTGSTFFSNRDDY